MNTAKDNFLLSKTKTMQPKKVLIITYYWPPAGGPGVQRWLKFSKYLPDFGWEPTVFIPENPSYPLLDESLMQEIPERVNTIKTKIWEPYQWAEKLIKKNKKFKAGQFDVGKNQSWKSKLSIWVRGNFFIPDARVFWVNPSIDFLKKHLSEHHYDALITTGPPHSLHLIGLGLKKHFPNLKWIADFRDPWTEISYYQHLKLTKWADAKHRRLEQQIFSTSDITLATSYTDAENFRKKGANAVCITNGFDTENTANITPEIENQPYFTLAYIGVLEQLRNPEILWKTLEEMVREDETFAQDFQLKFVGRIDDTILAHIHHSPLKDKVQNYGYLNHQEAFKEMQSSDMLLITNFPQESSRGIIPGKIFEYLATGNQILSFGSNGSDVETILKTTNAGKHFTYSQKDELKQYLFQMYQLWKSGQLKSNTHNIQAFSRKNLTQQLAEIL
ncbi:glycosyl transferase family 1 [Bergeyella porcorum]|uniref:Glycosyl transferase family 1 n=2 Tax=Bergeyella porcorum TaxID=1735111 RepID=A0AAU0EYJ6_9FLAO